MPADVTLAARYLNTALALALHGLYAVHRTPLRHGQSSAGRTRSGASPETRATRQQVAVGTMPSPGNIQITYSIRAIGQPGHVDGQRTLRRSRSVLR